MSRLHRFVLAGYGALIRLYPASFSKLFAAEMYAIFATLLEEAAPRGRRPIMRLALKELGGVTLGLVREHIHVWRTPEMTRRIVQSLITSVALGCLAFLVLVALFLDFFVTMPTIRIALLLTSGALGVLLGTLLYLDRRSRVTLIGLALFVTLNVGIWTVDWNSRKPFVRDLYQVQPGMTVTQADAIMSRYMRSPARPGTTASTFVVGYRHTTAAWGNADIGLITYDADGYVSDVSFLPD
jgi:hypothetical protein